LPQDKGDLACNQEPFTIPICQCVTVSLGHITSNTLPISHMQLQDEFYELYSPIIMAFSSKPPTHARHCHSYARIALAHAHGGKSLQQQYEGNLEPSALAIGRCDHDNHGRQCRMLQKLLSAHFIP
jgi:hypothetical protein